MRVRCTEAAVRTGIRACVLLVAIMFLSACNGSSAPSGAVLDLAIEVQDAAYTIVDTLNAGESFAQIGSAMDHFDDKLAEFEEANGPEQMSSYHTAITAWSDTLYEIGTSESQVMLKRQTEQLRESMDTAKLELDIALDEAGR
ncbi:MAG: hypothetical protein JRD89_17650 [Deltaproteobacteria bacterium]|nr:hypothetical protein [Deltaproteobacteria bacterium]